MFNLILYLAFNTAWLFVVDYFLSTFEVANIWAGVLFVIVLTILNWTLLPILKLLTFPINFVTLGFVGSLLGFGMIFLTTTIVKGIVLSGDLNQRILSILVISIGLGVVQGVIGLLKGV